jgi:hypothetical protein
VATTGAPGEVPGALQGVNDFGRIGYDGPSPPPGHGTHHYHFRLHALDIMLPLPPHASKDEVVQAMEGHVLAQGEIVATYSR